MNDHRAHREDKIRVHPGVTSQGGHDFSGLHLTVKDVINDPEHPDDNVLGCEQWTGGTRLYFRESDVDVVTPLWVA